jgi:hypothetical protein
MLNVYNYHATPSLLIDFNEEQYTSVITSSIVDAINDVVESINEMNEYEGRVVALELDCKIRGKQITMGSDHIELEGFSLIHCYHGSDLYQTIDITGISSVLLQVKISSYVRVILGLDPY